MVVEVDQNPLKIAIVVIFGVGFAIGLSFFIFRFFSSAETLNLVVSAVSACLLISVAIFQSIFIKKKLLLFTIVFFETIATLVPFVSHFQEATFPILAGGAILLFFLFFGASNRGLHMVNNSLRIHFFEIAKRVVPRVFTGIALFASVVVYLAFFEWKTTSATIGEQFFASTVYSAGSVMKIWFPAVRFDVTLKETLAGFVESQLQNNQEEFGALSSIEKEAVLGRSVTTILISLEKTFGTLNPNAPFIQEVYRIFQSLVQETAFGRVGVGIAVAFLVFLFLRGIASLFSWLVFLISFLLFKFLLITRFASIGVEMQSREFVALT